METLTIPKVFERVAKVTDEKIDMAFADVHQIESNPDLPKIPGMDLTANGRVLTYEQFSKLKKEYPSFVAEKEALKLAFADTNAYVMNKNIFHELCTSLGLVRIYQSENEDNTYVTNISLADAKEKLKKDIDLHNVTDPVRVAFSDSHGFDNGVFWLPFLGFIIAYWVVCYGFFDIEEILYPWLNVACATVVPLYLSYQLTKTIIPYLIGKDTFDALIEERKKPIKHLLYYLFDNGVVATNNRWGSRDVKSMVKVTVPNPPENVRKNIVSIFKQLPKLNHREQICTVADPYAVTIEYKGDVFPPRPADPGIVVEYGHFAVILPDTFYNITKLESSFLDACLHIAEKWDVKKYLLN